MSKHTPGPWELWTGCSWRRFGSETTGTTVCEPTVHPHDGHPDLHFRNGGADGPDARLIAAAPDLLEALQGLMAIIEESRGVDGFHLNDAIAEWDEFEDVGRAVKALAKATGESE